MPHSLLINFTLDGLKRCYMPDQGLWSYKYHLDGRSHSNESRPAYDAFYSLNVLLGLSRLPEESRRRLDADSRKIFETAVEQIERAGAPLYAYGMALWTAAELDFPAPLGIERYVRTISANPSIVESWTAQEIGLLLSGAVAQARADPSWNPVARRMRDHVLGRLLVDSGLFRDRAFGARRYFATFASQVYCTLSLYHYGEMFEDAEALRAADRCVARLISMQGPFGEWPWFYHVESGRVADFYEVYSVHQHGMAPAILKPAMTRGVRGAKEALDKGFNWILGENELGRTMLRSDLSLIARSQARQGLHAGRVMRATRAAFNALAKQQGVISRGHARIGVTPEVRSYELGWTLWSFGDDRDFPKLTNNIAFRKVEFSSPKQSISVEGRPIHVAAASTQGV